MFARYGRVNMRLQEEDNTAHKMNIRGEGKKGNKKKNRRFDGKNNTQGIEKSYKKAVLQTTAKATDNSELISSLVCE